MTPLCELAVKFGSDKYSKHHYTPLYYEMFKDRAESVKTVFEIGIGARAYSLRMWEAFFPNAQIIGADFKRWKLLNEGRIVSVYADQSDPQSIVSAAETAIGQIDIVIDDGSHTPDHQVSSALALMPLVSDGGIYIIEDICNDEVFARLGEHFACERVCTNPETTDSVLGIIRK